MASALSTLIGARHSNKLWHPAREFLIVALMVFSVRGVMVAQVPSFATVHSFTGNPDGADPHGALTIASDGILYGTTFGGGSNLCSTYAGTFRCGTVFALAPQAGGGRTASVIYNFGGNPDGAWPDAGLTLGDNGTMYGTTQIGGAGGGTVFQLAPPSTSGGSWTEEVLYAFPSERGSDSHGPEAPVLVFPDRTLYTTATDDSVVMLLPPAAPGGNWAGTTIYSFNVNNGLGATPFAGLVSESGALYGTTYYGSDPDCDCGAVYALSPPSTAGPWTATAIHSFTGYPADGGGSLADLTTGDSGVLYGTTYFGGSGTACVLTNGLGCGAVFQLTPPTTSGGPWTETVIYSFTGQNGDGAFPSSSLVLGEDGSLYGTTQYGGSSGSCSSYGATGCGTVFQLVPPASPGGKWTEKVLHAFTGEGADGAIPLAGLVLTSSGAFYGTTSSGGSAGLGTVYSIKP
jgi:uncharacterized repeat protein (TIGR03803 family)